MFPALSRRVFTTGLYPTRIAQKGTFQLRVGRVVVESDPECGSKAGAANQTSQKAVN